MSVKNLISSAPGGKPNRLILPVVYMGITPDHVQALVRALDWDLKLVRTSTKPLARERAAERYALLYDLVATLQSVASDPDRPFDACDYEDVTQATVDAITGYANREDEACRRAAVSGSPRSVKDRNMLEHIIGFVGSVIQPEDEA